MSQRINICVKTAGKLFFIIAIFAIVVMSDYQSVAGDTGIVNNDLNSFSKIAPNPRCGPRSLWIAAGLLGISKSIDELSDLCEMTNQGTTLLNLKNAAEMIGLQAQGVRCSWDELINFNSPAILLVYGDHFVCVDPRVSTDIKKKNQISFYNFSKQTYYLGEEELNSIWNGEALFIARKKSVTISQDKSKPRASFDYTFSDFGIASEDNIMTQIYTLSNTGSAPLEIISMKKTCGCAEIKASKMKIQPSETASISLEFDLHGRHGIQMIQGIIQTNDSENPFTVLSYRGFIEKPVLFLPNMFEFGEMIPGQSLSRSVIVTDRGDQTLQWRRNSNISFQSIGADNVKYNNNDDFPQCNFKYSPITSITQECDLTWDANSDRPTRFEKLSDEPLRYKFEVDCTIPLKAPQGTYYGELSVIGFRQYDTKDYPITIPISVSVVDDISISPKIVSFGIIPIGSSRVKQVTISSKSHNKIDLSNQSIKFSIITDDATKCSILPTVNILTGGDDYAIIEITLTIPEDVSLQNDLRPIKGLITFKVGQKEKKVTWLALPSKKFKKE